MGKIQEMMNKENTILLSGYFEEFVKQQIASGRYKDANEVISAGLRLLENEDHRAAELQYAIQEGIDSGIAHDFDAQKHLQYLKEKSKNNG